MTRALAVETTAVELTQPGPAAEQTPPATATQTEAAKRRAGRFWEIDALRGIAIITMIVYHTMWDLWYWGVFPNVVLWQGFWFYWQRFTCGTFLTLVGVSLTISNRRMRARAKPGERIYPHFFWRGLRIFGLGMIITVVVLFAGVGYVDFGILHLIGISIILAYPFLRFKWLNLGLWIVFSLAGKVVEWIHVDTRWLTPIGITPLRYPAVDFFPLIPWFGVVLLGIFLGNLLYADNKRQYPLPAWGDFFPFNALEFLGRHSLVIYMIHQPIILLVLYLLGIVRI